MKSITLLLAAAGALFLSSCAATKPCATCCADSAASMKACCKATAAKGMKCQKCVATPTKKAT